MSEEFMTDILFHVLRLLAEERLITLEEEQQGIEILKGEDNIC